MRNNELTVNNEVTAHCIQDATQESEIKSNDWLIWDALNNIIFEENPELIWLKVITSMGINIGSLSNQRGFA